MKTLPTLSIWALGALLMTLLPGLLPSISESGTVIAHAAPSNAGTSMAETNDEGSIAQHPLSLEDCLRIAVDRNPIQEAARQGIIAADESVGEKRAPYYPQFDLGVGYARRQTHAFLPGGLSVPSTIVGPTDDWSSGVIGHLVLFDSGKRRAELLAALANKRMAEEESGRIRQNLILNVHQAFYGLAAALENKTVTAKAMERALENLRRADERYAAGDVPLADSLRARVEKSDVMLDKVRADSLIQIAHGNLNRAMGLGVATDIQIIVPQNEAPAVPPTLEPEAIDKAVKNRPETLVARQRQEIAKQSVAAAKSAFGPQLSAKAQYGYRDDTFTSADQDWFAGVSVDIPIFSGFAKTHALNRKRAELSSTRAERKTIEQAVSQEVWDANWRLREKYEAINVADTMRADALESLRMAQERYENGMGTMADLLATQTSLAKAETVQVGSRWEYQVARAELQRAMGELKLDGKQAMSSN